MSTTELLPCPFCGAPGFAMLAAYGFKIKCTNTECTVETPIKTHRYQVYELWNRRASQPQQPAPADDKRALAEISLRALTAEARVRELEEAAVQPEPVATVYRGGSDTFGRATILVRWEAGADALPDGAHALYTAAAAVQPPVLPLTEEEIDKLAEPHWWRGLSGQTHFAWSDFARAIEAKVRGTGSVPPSANLDSAKGVSE